jgi:hypothetical protein
MANHALTALEAALDCAVAAAVDAQTARDEGRRAARLPKSPPAFYTTAQMVAEMCKADDRHRAEEREIVAAVIADFRHMYDPTYVPDSMHRALLSLFGTEAKTVDNVVRLASAREIIEAGRKRRGDQ